MGGETLIVSDCQFRINNKQLGIIDKESLGSVEGGEKRKSRQRGIGREAQFLGGSGEKEGWESRGKMWQASQNVKQ